MWKKREKLQSENSVPTYASCKISWQDRDLLTADKYRSFAKSVRQADDYSVKVSLSLLKCCFCLWPCTAVLNWTLGMMLEYMVIVTWARPQSLALPHWRIQFSFKLSLSSLPLDSTPGPSLQDGSSQHHQKDQTQGKGDADSHGVSIILWFQPFYFSHSPSKLIRLFILGFRCSLCSLSALKDSHYRVLGSHSWFFLLFGGSMIW